MRLSAHRNAVTTIAIGLEEPFELRMGEQTNERPGEAETKRIAVIPGGTWHRLDGKGRMAFLYLDSVSKVRWANTDRKTEEQLACIVREGLGLHGGGGAVGNPIPTESQRVPSGFGGNVVDLVSSALELPMPTDLPEPVATVARAVATNPSDFARIAKAARIAGISSSRFQSVFSHTVGVPFGRYRQWCRMGRVARVMAAGGALTDAALEAGFSSSAHLSSTFRTMFGIRPSDLIAAHAQFRFDESG